MKKKKNPLQGQHRDSPQNKLASYMYVNIVPLTNHICVINS